MFQECQVEVYESLILKSYPKFALPEPKPSPQASTPPSPQDIGDICLYGEQPGVS